MLMESLFVESCTDFQIGGTVYGHSCDVSDNSDDVSVVRNIRKKLSANVQCPFGRWCTYEYTVSYVSDYGDVWDTRSKDIIGACNIKPELGVWQFFKHCVHQQCDNAIMRRQHTVKEANFGHFFQKNEI